MRTTVPLALLFFGVCFSAKSDNVSSVAKPSPQSIIAPSPKFGQAVWTPLGGEDKAKLLQEIGQAYASYFDPITSLKCTVESSTTSTTSSTGPSHYSHTFNLEEAGDCYRYHEEQFKDGKPDIQVLHAFDGNIWQSYDNAEKILTIDNSKTISELQFFGGPSITAPFLFLYSPDPKENSLFDPMLMKVKTVQGYLRQGSWTGRVTGIATARIDGGLYYRLSIRDCYDPEIKKELAAEVILDASKAFCPILSKFLYHDHLYYTLEVGSLNTTQQIAGKPQPYPQHIQLAIYRTSYGEESLDGPTLLKNGSPFNTLDYEFQDCRFNSVDRGDFTLDPSMAKTVHEMPADKWVQVPR